MSRVNELLEGILLEDILDQEGVDYRVTHGSRGEQINIRECPFCGHSDWKVYANRDTGLGNCFSGSCQAKFNRYGIARQLRGDPGGRAMVEYLEGLARRIGWRPKRARQVLVETTAASDWELPKSVALPNEEGLNLSYLDGRKIDGQLARRFGLRYCQNGWWRRDAPNGKIWRQNFSDRVLIPVFDLDGTMVTFQGRDIVGRPKDDRYLFPLGLPGTGSFLYNAHTVAGQKHLLVCEGTFDVIAATRMLAASKDFADVGAIGTFGIDIADGRDGSDQVHRFLRLKEMGLKRVTLVWDGEHNAWLQAVKAALRLRSIGLDVWIAALPEDKDPAECDLIEFETAIRDAVQVDLKSSIKLKVLSPYRRKI